MLEISIVPTDMADKFLDKALPLLEKSIPYSKSRMTIDVVSECILSGAHNLWICLDGDEMVTAITTGITQYGERKFMTIHCCGGDRVLEWFSDFLDLLEKLAVYNECVAIEFLGRKGWESFVAQKGLKPIAALFHKDL
jgi:hypothetical protein